MNRKNIYWLLGLNEEVTAERIKKAFRQFAKENHPDIFPEDHVREERFKRVNSAYQHWKIIQKTVRQIKRLKSQSDVAPYRESKFIPWSFSQRV